MPCVMSFITLISETSERLPNIHQVSSLNVVPVNSVISMSQSYIIPWSSWQNVSQRMLSTEQVCQGVMYEALCTVLRLDFTIYKNLLRIFYCLQTPEKTQKEFIGLPRAT